MRMMAKIANARGERPMRGASDPCGLMAVRTRLKMAVRLKTPVPTAVWVQIPPLHPGGGLIEEHDGRRADEGDGEGELALVTP